jgi:N-acylglucosamine 2-epimerase
MNRRTFLRTSAGSTALIAGFPAAAPGRTADAALPWESGQTEHGGEGLLLTVLRDEYHTDLFEDFLPFMDQYVIDHERGGFMCNTDHLGNRVTDDKMSWYEGRGIWVYAFLYNNLAREEKYLDVARRSVKFILSLEPSGDEVWPRGLSREGKVLRSADGEISGDLYIAEGLAEFSKATGDRSHWDHAKQIVLKCVRLYDRPDYQPGSGKSFFGADAPPLPGARIQAVWMMLIGIVTQMLRMREDAQLEQIAARCMEAMTTYHYNPEFNLLNELLNHDLSRPSNQYGQLVHTGHSIEVLWFLLAEALRLNDHALFDRLAGWCKRHIEVAWDDVYGGVFRTVLDVNKNSWLLDKVLWAQEEVLIGTMLIIEQTGAQWARDLFTRMRSYVRGRYPLKSHGSPLWMHASDRKATYEGYMKLSKRVGNYHHPRHLMLNLLSIERMIKRGDSRI